MKSKRQTRIGHPESAESRLPPALEAELAAFEAEERERLGLPPQYQEQWVEPLYTRFTRAQRKYTTILFPSSTKSTDVFLRAALAELGYRIENMETPDNESLQVGKEFGSRGMCNPAYYTEGQLIRYLRQLHKEQGLTKEQINERYLLFTANGCGPCRFGMYLTEYRKALRESGFEGFRILLLGQTLEGQEIGEGGGIEFNTSMILAILKALMCGDILNILMCYIRPYEVEVGATDAAIQHCREIIADALENRRWLIPALWKVRGKLAAIRVDRTRIKPRVALFGEAWAMLTEGEGNYNMQRFLEREGAEVEPGLLTVWMLLLLWENRYDTRNRAQLKGADAYGRGLEGADIRKRLLIMWAVEKAGRFCFNLFARAAGLQGFGLPDMDALSRLSHEYYDNNQRGGEMHFEVAKLIQCARDRKAHMGISIKPFGCLPSSCVSDGVQSLVSEHFPQTIFLSVETTGDGAVNIHSRVQMQLFKARELAAREVAETLELHGINEEEARAAAMQPRYRSALHHSPHRRACTAANLFHQIGRMPRFRLRRLWRALRGAGVSRGVSAAPTEPQQGSRARK